MNKAKIKDIDFDGSILICRGTYKNNSNEHFLSIGKTDTKRQPGKLCPEIVHKQDTEFSDDIVRLHFKSKESIYALVTELILLSAEQFENTLIMTEEINE